MGGDFQPHEITWTQEKVANLWGYYATNRAYDVQYFSYHSGRSILEFVKRRVPLVGRRIVDFGCGPGFMIGHLLDEGIPCEGLEFSAEAIDVVRKKFGGHPLFRGAMEARQLPVPLGDDSVDVVFLVEVVEHLLAEQFSPAFQDIFRILRRGGIAVVTAPNAENLEACKVICPECGCIFHRWQHQRSFTAERLASVIEGVGFKTILCQPTIFTDRSPLHPVKRLYHRLSGTPTPPPSLLFIGQKA